MRLVYLPILVLLTWVNVDIYIPYMECLGLACDGVQQSAGRLFNPFFLETNIEKGSCGCGQGASRLSIVTPHALATWKTW